MRPLLKPSELARQLGVSRTWLYDAAKTGRIPSVRIGGEEGPLGFVAEDIERWLGEARAAWTPGRPSVATRRRPTPTATACRQRPRGRTAPSISASPEHQQSLL